MHNYMGIIIMPVERWLNWSSILFTTICFLTFKKHSVYSQETDMLATNSTNGSDKQTSGPGEINKLFTTFILKHKKIFNKEYDYEKRLKIFERNVEKINRLNKEYCDVKFAINKFADMTESEFNLYLGLTNTTENDQRAKHQYSFNGNAPKEFDWRDYNVVNAPKNQGSCGSCWAFCAIGAMESRYAIKHNVLYRLSEQQLVDCYSGKSCGGAPIETGVLQARTDGGIVLECDYKYMMKKNMCKVLGMKRRAKVKGYTYTRNMESEDLLKEIVYNNGPVVIGVSVSGDRTEWKYYSKGVASAKSLNCTYGARINHGVVIVGYGVTSNIKDDEETPYWIIKNSWGEEWGEKGYMRLERGENACNILSYVVDIFMK